MPIAPYAWGDPHSVAPSPMLSQHAEICALPGGGFAVAWTSNYDSVQVIRFDAFGNAIDQTPITVASGAAIYVDIAIAALPDGSIGVVWSQTPNGNPDTYDVWHAVIGPDGGFSADPALLGSPNANYQGVPEVAAWDCTQFMAVWQDNITTASGGSDIRSHLFLDYGATGGNSTINPTPDASYQTSPQIASLAGDGVVAAWKTGSTILFRFDTGSGLSPLYSGPVTSGDFDVAGLSDGRVVIAYTVYDPATLTYSVMARIYNADGTAASPFAAPIMVGTGIDAQLDLDVTETLDGGFMVIWTTSGIGPAPDGEILGRAFNAAGVSVNSVPFEIAPPDTGNETLPRLVTLSDGRIVVLWGQESNYVSDLNFQIFNPNIAAAAGTAGNDGIGGTDLTDVVEGLGGNDQIGGFYGDDTLRGGAGLDYLDGGWGVDTLEGGNDADFLFGSFGADSHAGGAGADWFGFDAGANAGDVISDYTAADRLLFVGSNAAPSFSVSGANVTVSGILLTGAASGDVTAYVQENSAFGHSASMAAVLDLLANSANALGAFGAYTRFVFDADNNAVWRVIQDGMTGSNLLDYRWTYNDAGNAVHSTFADLDQANANPWASVVTNYAAPGIADNQWTYYDAGQPVHSRYIDYDQANVGTWASVVTNYAAPGIADNQWTYYDAGQPYHSRYIDYDQANVETWAYHVINFSAPGVVANDYYV
ncbi:MAG: calcium-binding protein [Rhizobiaceae bacterium]